MYHYCQTLWHHHGGMRIILVLHESPLAAASIGFSLETPLLGHLVTVLIEINFQAAILTELHLRVTLGGEMDTIHHQIATFLTADTTTSDSIQ